MVSVWVFNGSGARFPSGVFESNAEAELWIRKYNLSGILTEYPLNTLVYHWAINNRLFLPKKDSHSTVDFIQSFTSASQNHFHYEGGERA